MSEDQGRLDFASFAASREAGLERQVEAAPASDKPGDPETAHTPISTSGRILCVLCGQLNSPAMSELAKAVFLSYASQDAAAARRICETLRASGVGVWFDQEGGLEHGDEWDAKIRRQIKECELFLPVISAHTQARHEGYFRIEWDLAAERAQGFAHSVPFILPIVIDDTSEANALVPERFRKVQWTRPPGGGYRPRQARFLLWSARER